MIKGVYCGDEVTLKEESAMLQKASGGYIAQFDRLALGEWAHGWHYFPFADWKDVIVTGSDVEEIYPDPSVDRFNY